MTPEALALGIMTYVVLLFSLSVHESAHGWVALRMGDDTAAREGRISLNPVVHIDPIGTLLIPFLQIFGGIRIPLAWAKPTPVQPHRFRQLARGHVLVSGAGPVSNMLLALLFTAGLFVANRAGVGLASDSPVGILCWLGISMNVALAVFNLVPVPPLDGSWIVSWGLPRHLAEQYDRFVEPHGQWLLLALIFPIPYLAPNGLLYPVMSPVIGYLALSLLRFTR